MLVLNALEDVSLTDYSAIVVSQGSPRREIKPVAGKSEFALQIAAHINNSKTTGKAGIV